MNRTLPLLTALACLAACNLDLAASEQAYFELAESGTSTTELDDDAESSTTGLGPFATVTSATPPDDDLPGDNADPGGPQILSFTASPDAVPEAGPVVVTVEHTPDVVEVMLFDEYNGALEHLADLAPGEPWTFAITSEADFEGTHELHAIVVDGEGRWDEATTVVEADLPPAGSPIWVNEGQDDDEPYFKFGLAAAAVDNGVIVAGRDLNAGASYSFVRRYAGDSGDVEWTFKTSKNVIVSDVEINGDGRIVVVGSITNNSITRAWVHMLDAEGAPVWDSPKEWLDNSEATAVAAADNGDLYVAGTLMVEDGIEHTDVFVWHLPANAMPTWATWDSGDATIPNDTANSILVTAEGFVFVGGTSTFDIQNLGDQSRTSIFEYSDALALRWADLAEDDHESSLRGLAAIDGDLAIAGTRRAPGEPYTLEVRRVRVGQTYSTIWTYLDDGVDDKLAVGIEVDPNGRLAVVGTVAANSDNLLTAVLDPDGELLWSENYKNFGGGDASASAITTDSFGYLYFVGTLAGDDGYRTIVGKRNP